MKTCKKCSQEKDLLEFYNNKKAPDGKMNVCKACDKARVLAQLAKKKAPVEPVVE